MKLRKDKMHYGKVKLQERYRKRYGEKISTWKIERVIRKHDLFPDPIKAEKQRQKLKNTLKKNRIQKLEIKEEHWFLLHLDTIVIYWGNIKRYILTAIDHHGKVAYARMYTTKSSRSAKDFLYRLHYLIDAPILNIQTDNGSEFFAEFETALAELVIFHWFSRPRTPKDNSVVERFNKTLQDEWLDDGHFTPVVNDFNRALTDWLEEYNFDRPHQTLDYMTPYEYLEITLGKQPACRQTWQKLLPTYSASALYPCEYMRSLLPYGNIRNMPLSAIRRTDEFQRLSMMFEILPAKCRDCEFAELCGNGCPATRELNGKLSPDGVYVYCEQRKGLYETIKQAFGDACHQE